MFHPALFDRKHGSESRHKSSTENSIDCRESIAMCAYESTDDMEAVSSDFAYRSLDRICYWLWNSRCHLAPPAREGGTQQNAFPINGVN